MSVIPCDSNKELKLKIDEFAEVLKSQAHTLGDHGLTEQEFYDSGLFRGAIERIRGQFSATMLPKRKFVSAVLDYMQAGQFISSWESAGESNRHDYSIILNSGKNAAIELKGCLDGNNTNIFDRPPSANEFVIWSVCTNPSASPRHNVWSGIHTRLGAEIISKGEVVDGLIVWDMVCGTIGRPCPKKLEQHFTVVGDYELPPPCLYLFPNTIPNVRNNPEPSSHSLENVELMQAFAECFSVLESDINTVKLKVENVESDVARTTTVIRNAEIAKTSKPIPIKRN